MAEAKDTQAGKGDARPRAAGVGNSAVQQPIPDRVAMLSLAADGTAAQTPNVEMIGDPDAIRAGAERQFATQAVSAADEAKRRDLGLIAAGGGEETPQDPTVDELRGVHEDAAGAAHSAAEATVSKLTS